MSVSAETRQVWLNHTLEEIRHVLPDQRPMGVFIHHNTLHGFQHLPFHQAVSEAHHRLGGAPYYSESFYRLAYERGRIADIDLDAACSDLLGSPEHTHLVSQCSERDFQKSILLYAPANVSPHTIQWLLDETLAISEFAPPPLREEHAAQRDLWRACQALSQRLSISPASKAQTVPRIRDWLLKECEVDIDETIHPILIRWCAAFFDLGLAAQPFPGREQGLYQSIRSLVAQNKGVWPSLLVQLPKEFRRQTETGKDASHVVLDALDELGIAEKHQRAFLLQTALGLRGWAGMTQRLEGRPHEGAPTFAPARLVDFLAVQLTLELCAARTLKRKRPFTIPLHAKPLETNAELARLSIAYTLFCVLKPLRAPATAVAQWTDETCAKIHHELERLHETLRRSIWHEAYERTYRRQILDALAFHQTRPTHNAQTPVSAQVVVCMDDREESFRRHVEEIDPNIETYGAAGFFGVAVDYRSLDDAHYAPFCPVVIEPKHAVDEHAHPEEETRTFHYQRWRAWEAQWARRARWLTRSLLWGGFLVAFLGWITALPLWFSVRFPQRWSQAMKRVRGFFGKPPRTVLTLTRQSEARNEHGKWQGFTPQEKAQRVFTLLTHLGLVREFAPVVALLGHGSTSANNPHQSAYDCGACGGRHGGMNARLFALFANDPAVRATLREQSIDIPDTTWFVGALHNTTNDEIRWFDVDTLSLEHQTALSRLNATLHKARTRNAHERCRRFQRAPLDISENAALAHVEGRAVHLAEPRPEYGHSSNALCVIGRRQLSRGLYLDRRVFLVSYDPDHDPEGNVLEDILGAVVPVGAGITLEYYFSTVDNEVYGCGTKLPHNVVGLLGVMNGAQSDLRTGLNRQMIEIHEAMRLLVVVETFPEVILKLAKRHRQLEELVANEWLQVVTMAPDTKALHIFQRGSFVPYEPTLSTLARYPSSRHYYAGKREHLAPVQIAREGFAHAA